MPRRRDEAAGCYPAGVGHRDRDDAIPVPSASAILDRFLHHAEIITITGRSYRLRNQAGPTDETKDSGPASKDGKRTRKEPEETPPTE